MNTAIERSVSPGRLPPKNQCWMEDVKRMSGDKAISVVFDIGANIGQVALRLPDFFPDASITCFEPVSEVFKVLSECIKGIAQINAYQLALSDDAGKENIMLYEDSRCNTFLRNLDESWHQAIGIQEVEITTIDQFVGLNPVSKIDILKLDVEGFELKVLQGAKLLLQEGRINYIYAEIGFNRSSRHQYFGDLCEFLSSYHFELSNFYEPFRDGVLEQNLRFCNALFVREGQFESLR